MLSANRKFVGSVRIFLHLQKAIAALPHTGPKGFEGLMRDALSECSGQQFRLVKSGPQGGIDALANESATRIQIGMEGKHYSATTRLRLDELKSKLRDAADNYPDLDLWILATSRPIDAGDKTALDVVGESLAVDVLVLDWAGHGATLSPLATLCAAAPAATAQHLGRDAALLSDLDAIRQHNSYDAERDRLKERLNEPTTGLDAARNSLAEWMRNQMRDTAAAKVAFDSYATLEQAEARNIARPSLDAAVDNWWATNTDAPLALIGGEGMGKTWQILNWWRNAADRHGTAPLTIVVPAKRVDGCDGPTLVADALARITGRRTTEFWLRRLRRWATANPLQPLILLVLDGLNQYWQYDRWQDILLSLQTPQWRGRIATAVTCRPDHWHQRLRGLPGLAPNAQAVQVEAFNDAEIDALLSSHGLTKRDFSPALVPLLRVPRLSRIAIEQRGKLVDGDITAARLVYEDWRGRGPGADLLGNDHFRDFVADLGRETLVSAGAASLTRAELLQRLDADSGRDRVLFEGVLGELIDGGWLKPTGRRNHFQLNDERVPAALALTLIADLRQSADVGDAFAIIGPLLDPFQALDISVAILRYATTFALVDPSVPRHVRRALMHEWLSAQNFSPVDFEEFWRLVGCDPHLLLDLAEHYWFEIDQAPRADEVIVKAFSNAFKWANVADAVTVRLRLWFSRYWLDYLRGEILGEVADDEHAVVRRDETRARATAARDEGVFERFGLKLEQVEEGRQAWGSYRAVELMSWLPREPMIDVFTAWALTRAVLSGFRQFKPMCWVLRWNQDDPEATAASVLQRARELAETGGSLARDSACTLLKALATPDAHRLLFELNGEAAVEPSDSIVWPETPSSSRYVNAPLQSVDLLRADPRDPTLDLPAALIDRLREAADSLTPEQISAQGQLGDGGFERARLALARWAPDRLANMARRRAECPTEIETEEEAAPASASLAELMLILSADQLREWRAFGLSLDPLSPNADAHVAGLFEAESGVQIDIIERLPQTGQLPSWLKQLLARPTAADLVRIAEHLDQRRPNEELLFWLNYLQQIADFRVPDGWQAISSLLRHDDTAVRTAAMKLALRAEGKEFAEILSNSGWSYVTDMDRTEAAYGSLLLVHAPVAATGGVLDHVHPEVWGELAERYPQQCDYLVAFAHYVRDELHHLLTCKSRTYPRSLLTGTRGWDALIENYGNELLQWTQPLAEMSDTSAFHLFAFAEPFPLLQALDARERLKPGAKVALITTALREQNGSPIRIGSLYSLASQSAGTEGEEARNLVLAEANNDQKLFDFSLALQEGKQADWLIQQIELDLAGPDAASIARGLTLAGQLWPSGAADALWAHTLAEPPAAGWLQKVHDSARCEYRRFTWALHWYERFKSEIADDMAYAAYELFVASLDERTFSLARPSPQELDSWTTRRSLHWSVNWPRVTKRVKDHKDALSKLYLATDLPLSNQAPRRT